MLYHIDDATESLTGNEIVGGAVGDAIIGLALASGAPVDNPDAANNQKNNQKQGNGNQSPDKDLPSASILTSTTPLSSLHHHSHMNHSSTPSLYPLEKVGKTNSVTSLSVGVQYDPRDLERGSLAATSGEGHGRYKAVEYVPPSNGLRRSDRGHNNSHQKRPEKSHFHVSAPDFHGTEMRRHSGHHRRGHAHDLMTTSASISGHQHHHHHHHHLHHKPANGHNGRHAAAVPNARTLSTSTPSRDFLEAASGLNHRGRYDYFGSLGRGGHVFSNRGHGAGQSGGPGGVGGGSLGSLSESDPEAVCVPPIWPLTPSASGGLHPPPLKSARLSDVSNNPSSRPSGGHSSRRYGSIRVAECSFIEADSPSTPPTSATTVKSATASASMSSAYNRQRRQYSLTSTFESAAGATVDPSLPSPPPSSQQTATSSRLCNGPLSLTGLGSHRSYNGQQSHIIPPPHNFSNNGDYAPLTTTRIGSSLNLATSRPTVLWPREAPQRRCHDHQQRRQPHHQQRPNSPPF